MDRFIGNKDGTITDSKTGFIWQKTTLNKQFNHLEAIEYSSKLSIAGEGNWRLPTIEELRSIVLHDKKDIPLIDSIFSCRKAKYWTSSLSHNKRHAWTIDFSTGDSKDLSIESYAYVRCIKDKEMEKETTSKDFSIEEQKHLLSSIIRDIEEKDPESPLSYLLNRNILSYFNDKVGKGESPDITKEYFSLKKEESELKESFISEIDSLKEEISMFMEREERFSYEFIFLKSKMFDFIIKNKMINL